MKVSVTFRMDEGVSKERERLMRPDPAREGAERIQNEDAVTPSPPNYYSGSSRTPGCGR